MSMPLTKPYHLVGRQTGDFLELKLMFPILGTPSRSRVFIHVLIVHVPRPGGPPTWTTHGMQDSAFAWHRHCIAKAFLRHVALRPLDLI